MTVADPAARFSADAATDAAAEGAAEGKTPKSRRMTVTRRRIGTSACSISIALPTCRGSPLVVADDAG